MKRWLIALLALLLGGGTAAVLLVAANPDAGTEQVLAAAHDVPSGAALDPGALQVLTVRLAQATPLAYPAGATAQLRGLRTTHSLLAGQVIQHSDVTAAQAAGPALRTLVVPVRSAPPLAPGDRVDLLIIEGAGGTTAVLPFASGLLVRAQLSGSIVVAVDPAQAGALAYVGVTTPLIAVAATDGAGGEPPVSTVQQAAELATR
ncbi:MAG TPA: SAF domain-containing protein [Candidatus Dormibacteraeota bacterium]